MAGTIKEIAEKAGVSRGTVDRALNNRGRINPEVAEKIKTIAKEMNYVPKKKKMAKEE
ncbi:LacI family DNA-binding transcriptional regulator, partial [Enterococcus faecalis]